MLTNDQKLVIIARYELVIETLKSEFDKYIANPRCYQLNKDTLNQRRDSFYNYLDSITEKESN